MKSLNDLNVKIYADGADLKEMLEIYKNDYVKGFTTNPSLMKQGGVTDYKEFAKKSISRNHRLLRFF